jgi:hypothetical protein
MVTGTQPSTINTNVVITAENRDKHFMNTRGYIVDQYQDGYAVRKCIARFNDTLLSISRESGVSLLRLMRLNQMPDPRLPIIGREIIVEIQKPISEVSR